jgi:hypothetical protein
MSSSKVLCHITWIIIPFKISRWLQLSCSMPCIITKACKISLTHMLIQLQKGYPQQFEQHATSMLEVVD